MTDATAGRGGVGIRLYVSGGEVAKRTFDQVGDSGKKMWAQIALGDKSANPAIRALSASVGEARSGVDGLASRAGPAASILGSFGAAGIAAAAGLGGMALALNEAQKAMDFAAELTDTADRIGIGVEQLQAWNFVADEAGVSTEAFQANLEKLNGVLGAFKSGIGDGKLKPVFEELGITTDQLQNVETADQLMMILADTLGQVKDRALQVKFARSLGVEESLPILRLGSEGVRELSDEAERLGLVMGKDVVEALDAADRQLELAQQRIDSTVRLAVAGLAEDFADLVGVIAGAVAALARWDAQVKRLSGAGERGPRGVVGMISDNLRGRTAEEGEAARDAGAQNQPGWMSWLGFNQGRREAIEREQRRQRDMNDIAYGTGDYSDPVGGFDPEGHTVRGGNRSPADTSSRDEERRARDAERALDALARQELEARRDAIQARYGPGGPEESALQLGQARLILENESVNAARLALTADLEKAGVHDEEARARLEALRLAQESLSVLQNNALIEEDRRDLAAKRLRAEEVSARDAIELLEIQEQMAGTARERYEIGRRILLAEQALERKLLRAQLEADGLDGDERRQLRDQRRNQSAQVELFDHNRQEELRQTFNSYGREVVQAIEDGRIGEYIGDKIKERLLDGALNALFNAIGGGDGGKSGGGFLSSLFSFGASLLGGGGVKSANAWAAGGGKLSLGRAAGGDVRDGFVYRMAEHGPELLLMGGKGQVTSAAETAKMVKDLAGPGGAGGGVTVHASYAPNIRVDGSGPEIDALRRQLATEQANFKSNVVEAVAEAQVRRIL